MAGKTPQFPKPDSSAPKFARPRSQQRSSAKKQDGNCTVLGSERSGFSLTSTRSLNSTVRRNLDITLARPGNTQLKSKFATPTIDYDLQLTLAYNEYLQSVMKKQILKQTTCKHQNLLDDQIFIQSENLYKLQQDYKEIQNKIENLKVQSEVVEILDFLSESVVNLNEVFNKLDTTKSVVSVCDTLTEESNLVKLNNIKPIETQEEYNQLIQNVSNLVSMLEKVLNSGRNFNGIAQLGEDVRKFNELKLKVENLQKKIDGSRKSVSVSLIRNASDMFASLGGYE